MVSIKRQHEIIDNLLFPYSIENPQQVKIIKAVIKDVDFFDPKLKYQKKKIKYSKYTNGKCVTYKYRNYPAKLFSEKSNVAIKSLINTIDNLIAVQIAMSHLKEGVRYYYGESSVSPTMKLFRSSEEEIIILALRKILIREIENGSRKKNQ